MAKQAMQKQQKAESKQDIRPSVVTSYIDFPRARRVQMRGYTAKKGPIHGHVRHASGFLFTDARTHGADRLLVGAFKRSCESGMRSSSLERF